MSKNKIYITFDENSRYSNHNNILTDIVKKLEDITNELNKENIEEIKERIYDIIIMTNRIITENYRSLKGINEKIKSLPLQYRKQFITEEKLIAITLLEIIIRFIEKDNIKYYLYI